MAHVSPEEVEQIERRATEQLADGSASESVQLALDQLTADRTNGEPLDTAVRHLHDALDASDHPANDPDNDDLEKGSER